MKDLIKRILREDSKSDIIKDMILNGSDFDDWIRAVKLKYGEMIPLYHATTKEISKIIDKEGFKLTYRKNYKSFSPEPLIYFQLGKSDYVSTNRPVLYKIEVPIEFLYNADIDMDNPDVSDEELSEYVDMNNWDNLPYEIKDAIIYFIWNDFKLEGTELLFMNRFMDNPNENPFKNIKPIKIKSINESEQSKKGKLFIPRRIVERDVEFEKLVKDTNDKFLTENNIKSLKYSIKTYNQYGELSYSDIGEAFWDNTDCEVIFNNNEKWVNSGSWTKISHPDFIDYSHIMSNYLNKLIRKNYYDISKIIGLDISIESVVGNTKIDGIIVFVSYDYTNLKRNIDRINFSKTI
jgi:hypothetical protein